MTDAWHRHALSPTHIYFCILILSDVTGVSEQRKSSGQEKRMRGKVSAKERESNEGKTIAARLGQP